LAKENEVLLPKKMLGKEGLTNATVDGRNLIIYRVLYIPGGAAFLPSTVGGGFKYF